MNLNNYHLMVEDPKDVDMKDVSITKEEVKSALAVNPIYAGKYMYYILDYKKCLMIMEKALSIKDTKSLVLNYRQINKFRKHFNEDEISYLYDTLLRNSFDCKVIPHCEASIKV